MTSSATGSEGQQDGHGQSSAKTREALLDAAMTEFAELGFSGARVAAIAERAGVNKQLISYHFGGKQGLYDALQQQWSKREEEFRTESNTLGDLAAHYLHASAADPRGARLNARWLLDADGIQLVRANSAELDDLEARQRSGQIAPELETRALLLAIIGMVSAPQLLSAAAGDLIDGDLEHYERQLRIILDRLGVRFQPVDEPDGQVSDPAPDR